MKVLPRSVQIVAEDKPLLRVVEVGGQVIDYELRLDLLPLLAKQALEAWGHLRPLGDKT